MGQVWFDSALLASAASRFDAAAASASVVTQLLGSASVRAGLFGTTPASGSVAAQLSGFTGQALGRADAVRRTHGVCATRLGAACDAGVAGTDQAAAAASS